MKLFFVVLISAAAVMAADGQTPAKKASPAASKAAGKSTAKVNEVSRPAAILAIPAGAVADETGDYHYTDPQAKKWIYRKTPFGVARLEDTAENSAPRVDAKSGGGITAFEDGDKVRFERKGPFGVWKWEKKKSEMDESERAALQNSMANRQDASKE